MTESLEELLQELHTWQDVSQGAHFEKQSYKRKGKIFLTVDTAAGLWCVKLSSKEQDLFALFDRSAVYPVPNQWGTKGWTYLVPTKIPILTLRDILLSAWNLSVGQV